MTDNEIINCLNNTVGTEHISIYCTDKNGNYTTTVKLTDIIDLINRQKTEIDKLLQKMQQVESKARKEFWETLKKHRLSEMYISVNAGDRLLKEMEMNMGGERKQEK